MTTTILAGGQPLSLLAEQGRLSRREPHLARRRRAYRQGGELSRPRRAGAARHDQRDAGRRWRAARLHRRAAHRLPRRLPALGARPRGGDAGGGRRVAPGASRTWSSCWCAATTTTVPAIHRASSGSTSSTSRSCSTASRSAITRSASLAPMCWPAICILASASAGAAGITCACPASGSATTSPCCRRSAPSPACIRFAPRAGDRVFAIADDRVAAMPIPARAVRGLKGLPLHCHGHVDACFAPAPDRARRGAPGAHRGRRSAPARRARLERVDAFRYRKRGGSGVIEPVRHVAAIRLASLVEVGPQKERLVRNTEQFVAGHAANNVLLTGARGTGKSSLIKACLQRIRAAGAAPDRGRQDRPGRSARHRRSGRRAARALHRLLRRPLVRRRRARLQGAEVDPRRLDLGGVGERADLRHQQPSPPAARVHEGEPDAIATPKTARSIPARSSRRRSRSRSASACG